MKKTLFILFLFSIGLNAQEVDYSQKVATIDSTIATLYSVISGDKGKERNWDLFQYLFKKDAKLIVTGKNEKKETTLKYMSSEEYIESSGRWIVENGFYELELKRETQTFGNITHVLSTYEGFTTKKDKKSLLRGINSIQLFNDGKRWWIVNLLWKQESNTNPIPEAYLPKK
ncbi:hypothetical protein [Winogradskyella wichelsiae]|uniref:hypothetical protein n=1 Tax=Winogradskyella wichelsiae TaxID=2697007 RepID=UPI003EF46195